MPDEMHHDSPDSGGKPLCLRCIAPNEPSAHFCAKCGAPLTSYAATGPFEHIFAEGDVYRQAADRPQKLFVVIGVWLLFGMIAVAGAAIFSLYSKGIGQEPLLGILGSTWGLFVAGVSVAMIWKTTRNYLTRKKADPENEN